jgi:hypothetical protein
MNAARVAGPSEMKEVAPKMGSSDVLDLCDMKVLQELAKLVQFAAVEVDGARR